MTTLYEAKGQARRLAEYLASLSLPLNHSQALEAIARSHGAQSWNVFSSEAAQSESLNPQAHAGRSPGVSKFVTFGNIISHATAHELGAVHIQARNHEIKISQRIRGLLQPIANLGAAEALTLGMDMRSVGFDGFDELLRVPHRMSLKVRDVEFNVNTVPVIDGFDVVLSFPSVPRLHELGMTELRAWSRLLRAGRGLVLVGGDSTTGLDVICATAGEKVLNEIGVAHKLIESKLWVGVPPYAQEAEDFGSLIMTQLRCDPSVIVTEVRTGAGLDHLLRAAETGHLVIATVQSEANPVKTLQRLEGLVPAEERSRLRSRLQASLVGILSQQKVHPHCEFCDGDGCSRCFGTGRGLAEILSTVWASDGPRTDSVSSLLAGTVKFRTLADDLAVKENLGMRFDDEVLASL